MGPQKFLVLLIILATNSLAEPERKIDEREPGLVPEPSLNDSFIPSHYNVEIQLPDSANKKDDMEWAQGKVVIEGVNKVQRDAILLHGYENEINESTVAISVRGSRSDISVKKISKVGTSLVEFQLGREIRSGEELEISMWYGFGVRDCRNRSGYPVCSFAEANLSGPRLYAGVPHTKYTIFPSFNEPHLKTTFEMTIVRKEVQSALFSTKVLTSTPDPVRSGWVKDKFAKTRKLSPSMIAFFVSSLPHVESTTGSKTSRIYSTKQAFDHPESRQSWESINQHLASLVVAYDEYFNDTSRFPKMDFVIPTAPGVPLRMAPGVTVIDRIESVFAEVNYPYELWHNAGPRFDPYPFTRQFAYVMARQWIGNLWNRNPDMYMNYPLTRYVHYTGLKSVLDPEGAKSVILNDRKAAMESFTKPLKDVKSPPASTIEFPEITSGVSLLRMVESVLGKRTMQTAMQLYVNNVQEANIDAGPSDLFETLEKAAVESKIQLPRGLNMSSFMQNWADQPGYPVVRVGLVNETHVKFAQESFAMKNQPTGQRRWYIPVTYVTQSNPSDVQVVWLENDGVPKVIRVNSSEWVLVNPGATGYFRTLYDAPLLRNIQKQLKTNASVFCGLTRGQLFNDLIEFDRQEYLNESVKAILGQTDYLGQESQITAWKSFLDWFPLQKFASHPIVPQIRKYLEARLNAALTTLGSNTTGSLSILKDELLVYMCTRDPAPPAGQLCAKYAEQLLALKSKTVGGVWYSKDDKQRECAMAAAGGREVFQYLSKLYKEHFPHEDLADVLGCIVDPLLIKELIQTSFESGDVQPILGLASSTKDQWVPVWQSLSTKVDDFIQKMGNGTAKPVADVLSQLAKHFSTDAQLKQVTEFVDKNKNKLSGVMDLIEESVNQITRNIGWMNADGKTYLSYFSNQK